MSYTGDQKREYSRLWIKERRRLFFSDKFCSLCGSFYSLELHHNDPKKKVSHKIFSWSKERRNEEIRKCSIVCRLCHEAISICERRSSIGMDHGSRWMYKTKKCRCFLCRRWNADRTIKDRELNGRPPSFIMLSVRQVDFQSTEPGSTPG